MAFQVFVTVIIFYYSSHWPPTTIVHIGSSICLYSCIAAHDCVVIHDYFIVPESVDHAQRTLPILLLPVQGQVVKDGVVVTLHHESTRVPRHIIALIPIV